MKPPDNTPRITGEWECMECGYTEEGSRQLRPKACFECGAPASALEFFPYEQLDRSGIEDWGSDDLDADSAKCNDEEEDDY